MAQRKSKKKDKAPDQAEGTEVAPAGHNRGQVIPDLAKDFEEIESIREQKRVLSKAETEVKNRIKKKYNFSKRAVSDELKDRAMDKTTRTQHESERHDLKVALGYQMSMDLLAGTVGRTENEFADPSDPEAEANKLAGVARKKVG